MIRHIVLFRFKDKEGREEKVIKVKAIIDDLKHKIPVIVNIEGGININTRPQAFDVALVGDFRNHEDLETYRVHPDHLKLIEYLRTSEYELVVTDYEY